MTRMNGQTKIIVATACCLALVDIGVRLLAPSPFNSNCSTCPPLTLGDGVVRARAIELVDGNNNVRGLWNTDANGEPALWMYDRNGATRIELDTTDTTPSLSLHDSDGNRRVYFGMDNADGTGLYQMLLPDSQTATFSLDGTNNRPHFTMNGNGQFTQTLPSGVAYDAVPLPHQIFAQGVRSDQAEIREQLDAKIAESEARLIEAQAELQSKR